MDDNSGFNDWGWSASNCKMCKKQTEVVKGEFMKRWITILTFLIIMMLRSVTALAGDIPESLLYSDDAQIFFGEVLAYHPDKENPDIEVSPAAVIKGKVKEGTKQVYDRPNPMGDFHIQVGKVYLFTYYDDVNDTDIFEVTTYNTRTLKLKHVEGSMWERFEKYLNDGEYGEAKIEGMMPYTADIIRGSIGAVICGGVIGLVVIYKKKKQKQVCNKGGI